MYMYANLLSITFKIRNLTFLIYKAVFLFSNPFLLNSLFILVLWVICHFVWPSFFWTLYHWQTFRGFFCYCLEFGSQYCLPLSFVMGFWCAVWFRCTVFCMFRNSYVLVSVECYFIHVAFRLKKKTWDVLQWKQLFPVWFLQHNFFSLMQKINKHSDSKHTGEL